MTSHRPQRPTRRRALVVAGLAAATSGLALAAASPGGALLDPVTDLLGPAPTTTVAPGDDAGTGGLAATLTAAVTDPICGALGTISGALCSPPTTTPPPPTTDPVPPTTDPAPPTTDPAPPTTDPVPPTTDPAPPTTDPAPDPGGGSVTPPPAQPGGPAAPPVPSGGPRAVASPAPGDSGSADAPRERSVPPLDGPTARVDADAGYSSLDDEPTGGTEEETETETDLVAVHPANAADMSDARRGFGVVLLAIGLGLVGIGAAGTVRKRITAAAVATGSGRDGWSGTPWGGNGTR